MNPVGVGLALATGLGSALVPVLSAEVHALVVATGPLHTLPAVVLALAAGQAAGKLVLFETGRRGRAWHPWGRRCPPARTAQWTERVGEWLRTPRHGVPQCWLPRRWGFRRLPS